MKRIGLILLFIANALFASVGSVSLLEGEATIKRADKILNVSLGTKVEKNDIIQTKQNSKVRIDFVDKTIVTIGKQSTLNIKDYYFSDTNPKAARTELSVTEGAFHAITGQIGKVNPNKFKIKTKNATIGIRGTEIYGDQSKVICTQGMIFVQSPLGDVKDVAKGSFVSTQAGKPLGKVTAVDSENLNSVLDSFNTAQTATTTTTESKSSTSESQKSDSQKDETSTQSSSSSTSESQSTSNASESQSVSSTSSTQTTSSTSSTNSVSSTTSSTTTTQTSTSVATTASVTSSVNDSLKSWGDWDSENKNSQIAKAEQATKDEISQKERDEAEKKMQEQEEARKKAEAEAKQKADEEAEAKRKAEEAQKQKELAEAEAKQKAEEEAEAKRKAEEAQKQKELAEQEAKRQAEELAKKQAEEAEAKRKAEEDAKKAEEARKKAEQEATEQARREAEEAQRQKELAEAEARRQAEELARKQAEEAEAKRKAEEAQRQKEEAEAEARRQAEELARQKAAEEEAKRQAEEAARKAEEARKQAEEAAKKAAEAAVAYKTNAVNMMRLFEESSLQYLTTRMMNSNSKIELDFAGSFKRVNHLSYDTRTFKDSENSINFKFLFGRGGAGGLNQFTGNYKYVGTDNFGKNYNYGGNFAGRITGRRNNGTDFEFNDVGTDKTSKNIAVIRGSGFFNGKESYQNTYIEKVQGGKVGNNGNSPYGEGVYLYNNTNDVLNVYFEADLTGGKASSQ